MDQLHHMQTEPIHRNGHEVRIDPGTKGWLDKYERAKAWACNHCFDHISPCATLSKQEVIEHILEL